MPLPAATSIRGVCSGIDGRWNAAGDGRTDTRSLSSTERLPRYELATPMYSPRPDLARPETSENVMETIDGSSNGDEEIELRTRVS